MKLFYPKTAAHKKCFALAMQVFFAMPQQNHLGNDVCHFMRKQYGDVALGSERKGENRIGRNTM